MSKPVSVREAALSYLDRRWSVIPILQGDKRPLIPWQPFQYRHPRPAEVKEWFTLWPEANLAVVTGAVSGLVVLDVDPRHGGEESLAEWTRLHGPLPETTEASTGGGGRHLYFAHPGGIVRNRVAVASGIDLRGDGGYVVAPPSLHASGERYRWRKSRSPDRIDPASLPHWLIALLTASERPAGHSLAHWRGLVREGVAEGERNNTIASFCGHLLWHGVDAEVAMELLLCWNRVRCRPPLPEDEVMSVVRSIARLHERHIEIRGGADEGDDCVF